MVSLQRPPDASIAAAVQELNKCFKLALGTSWPSLLRLKVMRPVYWLATGVWYVRAVALAIWLHAYYKKPWVMQLYFRFCPPHKKTWCALLEHKGVNMPAQNIWWQTLSRMESFVARDDDVFVVTYPKCGTHMITPLVIEILWCRRFERDARMQHARLDTPGQYPLFLEFGHPDFKKLDQAQASPRVFQTHLPAELFPGDALRRGARIVYMTRCPRACTVSGLHFCRKKKRKLCEPTADEFVDSEWSPDVQIYGGWHQHAADWAHFADGSSAVLTLTFEEVVDNPAAAVLKLASFLGRSLTEEDVAGVVARNSLQARRADAATSDKKYFRSGKTDGAIKEWSAMISEGKRSEFEALFADRWASLGMDRYRWLHRYAPLV